MKIKRIIALAGFGCAFGLGLLPALAFDCGSDGSYGAMNITTDTTLNMPSNGVFNCTTITVASGKTLRFNRNPLNTPVYLLATGDVTITGTINLNGGSYSGITNGAGGPGGFDGGWGGTAIAGYTQAGDGLGPGGGKRNGSWYGGAFGANASSNTNTYGNSWCVPLISGSGGAGRDGNPGQGGGGGGGALLIASNTKITVSGSVNCAGGGGYYGGGSGGAIRLVAPIVTGSGNLNCGGGGTAGGYYYDGSGGRIRIDCPDNYSWRALSQNGVATRGTRMYVFLAVVPRLDVIQAAGQSIPEGAASGVQIDLPAGSPTNQVVTVQARDFTNAVPFRVVITPVTGPSSNYDGTINMAGGNPSSTNVNVVIPAGSICNINAWTR